LSTGNQKGDSGKLAGDFWSADIQAATDVKRLAEILGQQVRRIGEIDSRLARLERAAHSGRPSQRKGSKR